MAAVLVDDREGRVPVLPGPRRVGFGPRRRPVPVARREIRLHGQRVTYLESGAPGAGPVVVLLHGLAGSSATWSTVMPLLGRHAHVIAPDLLGHGESAKPPSGDYSLGAYATGLRDLLLALELDRASIVGHSLGGGVAMQFAYQFPELTERLALVASGGLGREVTPALRAASLPGTAAVLRMLTALTPGWVGRFAYRAARAVPVIPTADLDELARALASLADSGARGAFVQTTRTALTLAGQRLGGTDRLYLLAGTPVLLVGGGNDSCIPVEHTVAAHERLPGSRLEVFDGAGHFPHMEHPQRFARVLRDFLRTTEAAPPDPEALRLRLRTGDGGDARGAATS
ncbi:alpha/beta fold hydrolase [Pseudonocardia bannensis]|uniref:Alpha/beta fold hydrolase n=1 Tax=Pseudonocardia bannensis TaxID=630973 RepID=A0A848DHU4_9PSEU|nr:alpha/beta fold hydrolase [Pseudonocardia bannensis]NMH92247.1 alpha/beta fold hydrolase [Pseudonocardia bannensis]